MIEKFSYDDDAYLQWIELHATGFVLNAGNISDPNTRLHRTDCYTVNGNPPRGKKPHPWTGYYEKWCSLDKEELIVMAQEERHGRPPRLCLTCKP